MWWKRRQIALLTLTAMLVSDVGLLLHQRDCRSSCGHAGCSSGCADAAGSGFPSSGCCAHHAPARCCAGHVALPADHGPAGEETPPPASRHDGEDCALCQAWMMARSPVTVAPPDLVLVEAVVQLIPQSPVNPVLEPLFVASLSRRGPPVA